MATIGEDITLCQKFLRDRNAVLWSRAELLRWYNDGLRRLLAESQGVRRFTVLALPPRLTMSISASWERRYVQGGTSRQFTFGGTGPRQVTTLWELEQHSRIDEPTASYPCVTQLWELAYVAGGTDSDYRFALPRDHDRLKAMWYDHKPLVPLGSRALDSLETAWNRSAGEPWVWIPGYGPSQSFEVYQIRTEYSADYEYHGGPTGHPRRLSGARTYTPRGPDVHNGYAYTTEADAEYHQRTRGSALRGMGLRVTHDATPDPGASYQSTYVWEREMHLGLTAFTEAETLGTYWWEAAHGATNVLSPGVGLLRSGQSPERQYMTWQDWRDWLGIVRSWTSSVGNLLLHEAVLPEKNDLTELDTPVIIPAQMQKYLRYYVLACAFGHTGEGFRPDLAAHYQARWQRGPMVLRKLGDLTYADQQHQRQSHGHEVDGRLSRQAPFAPEYGRVRV